MAPSVSSRGSRRLPENKFGSRSLSVTIDIKSEEFFAAESAFDGIKPNIPWTIAESSYEVTYCKTIFDGVIRVAKWASDWLLT